jgi:PAS domain-containing protein
MPSAAARAETEIDAALNNMVHGLCMFDDEGRVILFNERYGIDGIVCGPRCWASC